MCGSILEEGGCSSLRHCREVLSYNNKTVLSIILETWCYSMSHLSRVSKTGDLASQRRMKPSKFNHRETKAKLTRVYRRRQRRYPPTSLLTDREHMAGSTAQTSMFLGRTAL